MREIGVGSVVRVRCRREAMVLLNDEMEARTSE